MFNKEKLEQAMGILGALTEEQKALLLDAAEKEIPEKELFEKLGVDEKKYAEFLTAVSAGQEEEILAQDLSKEELDSVAGGGNCPSLAWKYGPNECRIGGTTRWIYRNRFPNCAKSVEDGSWCWSNDACFTYQSIYYTGMDECSKAWR